MGVRADAKQLAECLRKHHKIPWKEVLKTAKQTPQNRTQFEGWVAYAVEQYGFKQCVYENVRKLAFTSGQPHLPGRIADYLLGQAETTQNPAREEKMKTASPRKRAKRNTAKVHFSLKTIFLIQVCLRNLTELLGTGVLITFSCGEEEAVRIKKASFRPTKAPLPTDPIAKIILLLDDSKKVEIKEWRKGSKSEYTVTYLDTHPSNMNKSMGVGVEIGTALRRISHPSTGSCSPMVIDP